MTSFLERQALIKLIQQAQAKGARLNRACIEAGICLRTYRRWFKGGKTQSDQRPTAVRAAPSNKLTQKERTRILELCNSPQYSQLPPTQIVPDLLDKGIYIASESSFYRVLKEANQLHHRGRSRAPQRRKEPATHVATAPCQVWCWDITYCPTKVRGQFYYLYMFEDLYSRKIVGYEVYEAENGKHAAQLLQRSLLREKCLHQPLVLHSDNGAPMKASTMKAKLEELGVLPSYSRPRVSNDNAFMESLFRVLKYREDWPSHGFASLAEARNWVEHFVRWYNTKHRHSKINFVTPQQRHQGKDAMLLANRKDVLELAKQNNPQRWGSRSVRNCQPVGAITLNPAKETEIKQAA